MADFKAIQLGYLLIAAYAKKSAMPYDLKGFAELADIEVIAGEAIQHLEMFGFIVEDCESVAIVIPGTTSFYDWENNADLMLINGAIGDSCSVTKGIFDLTIQIERFIKCQLPAFEEKGKPLYITGHSLGAAIAENIFLRNTLLMTECYSFAAPRSRTEKIPCDKLHRIFNRHDIVPRSPLNVPVIFELKHSGVEHEVLFNFSDVKKNHAIENYVHAVIISAEG